jgi:hypothetical protein
MYCFIVLPITKTEIWKCIVHRCRRQGAAVWQLKSAELNHFTSITCGVQGASSYTHTQSSTEAPLLSTLVWIINSFRRFYFEKKILPDVSKCSSFPSPKKLVLWENEFLKISVFSKNNIICTKASRRGTTVFERESVVCMCIWGELCMFYNKSSDWLIAISCLLHCLLHLLVMSQRACWRSWCNNTREPGNTKDDMYNGHHHTWKESSSHLVAFSFIWPPH